MPSLVLGTTLCSVRIISRTSTSRSRRIMRDGRFCFQYREIHDKLTDDCVVGKIGRFTVPVLFDKKTQSIVNNESSEIIRIFNTAFNDQIPEDKVAVDIYPEVLRKDIDEANEWVYHTVNSELTPLFLLSGVIH